jgi:hypothetical protein
MAKEFHPDVMKVLDRHMFGKGRTVDNPKERDFSKYKELEIGKDSGGNAALFFSKGQRKGVSKILGWRKRLFHRSSLDSYKNTTMIKKLRNPQKALREIIGGALVTAASLSSREHDQEISKLFFTSAAKGDIAVGVRFLSGFKGVNKMSPDELSRVDAGPAVAQSFWVCDSDGHSQNLGVVKDSNTAVRIDFDCSFDSMGSFESIVQRSMTQGSFNPRTGAFDSYFPLFISSMSSLSCAEEMERLANMDYANSPQFNSLLTNVVATFKKVEKFRIESEGPFIFDIKHKLASNSLRMKFAAEFIKINYILKNSAEVFLEKDLLLIKESLKKLESLMVVGAENLRAIDDASVIFGIAATNPRSVNHEKLLDFLKTSQPYMADIFMKGLNKATILNHAKNPDKEQGFRNAIIDVRKYNIDYLESLSTGEMSTGWGSGSPLLKWRAAYRALSPEHLRSIGKEDPIERKPLESLSPEDLKSILIMRPRFFSEIGPISKEIVFTKLRSLGSEVSFPKTPEYEDLRRFFSAPHMPAPEAGVRAGAGGSGAAPVAPVAPAVPLGGVVVVPNPAAAPIPAHKAAIGIERRRLLTGKAVMIGKEPPPPARTTVIPAAAPVAAADRVEVRPNPLIGADPRVSGIEAAKPLVTDERRARVIAVVDRAPAFAVAPAPAAEVKADRKARISLRGFRAKEALPAPAVPPAIVERVVRRDDSTSSERSSSSMSSYSDIDKGYKPAGKWEQVALRLDFGRAIKEAEKLCKSPNPHIESSLKKSSGKETETVVVTAPVGLRQAKIETGKAPNR